MVPPHVDLLAARTACQTDVLIVRRRHDFTARVYHAATAAGAQQQTI
jgi:hypothetical protein